VSTFLPKKLENILQGKSADLSRRFIYAGKRDNLPYLKTTPPGASLLSAWIPDPGGERYLKTARRSYIAASRIN
jgi:hypothetical protein